MGGVTSLRDIFTIEHSQVCSDFLKYGGKNMKHYKAYKRAVEYTFGVHLLTYCTNKEKCMYMGQFLMEILTKHWETIKTQIKKFPTLEFDYEAFIKMFKERLLLQKVRQIEVRIKLKFLHQRNSQILSKFISHLKVFERDIEPPPMDTQKHQNFLYSMHNYL